MSLFAGIRRLCLLAPLAALFFPDVSASAQIVAKGGRPSLVAIQVESLDKSISWYTTYLGFSIKEKKHFPDHNLKLAFLTLKDFELELVENSKTIRRSEVLAAKGASDITGFAKLTFSIDNVGGLYEQLKEKGAAFAIKLQLSNVDASEEFFIVLDDAGNWLQFKGKRQ
jgi:catechol 2,3-dioxygenase-like lactoylglutathione lyase family enzyme